MTDKIGFIDEYGDKSIYYEKSGVSIFFIITAIIVDAKNVEQLKQQFDLLRKKYTQSPEVKSNSKAFRNPDKRLAFLTELSKLDFHIYSVIVDKRKIFESSGLKFRDSFFKYTNNLLDADLYRYFPYLEIVADEHGDDKFMNGFIDYVKKNHEQTELFRKPEFRFANSKSEVLIQLADFISGAISRCYDPNKRIENPNIILDILDKKILHLREWPETPVNFIKQEENDDEVYNHKIADFTLNQIAQFNNKYEHSKLNDIKNQLICLHYLVFRFRNNPYSYIYADEIIDRINVRGVSLTKRNFTKDVIGKLREFGIPIVSSQSGYKLPCSKNDLIRFFNNYTVKILPMLNTLEQFNFLTKTATLGDLDILNIKEFNVIKELIRVTKVGTHQK